MTPDTKANSSAFSAQGGAPRSLEQKLLQAQVIAKMGDFECDLQSGKVVWSEGMYRLLGYDRNEVIDLSMLNARVHHPDDLPRIAKWLQDAFASDTDALPSNEYRLIKQDGTVIHVRAGGLITRQDGEATTLFGTCVDITEAKMTESKLRNAQRCLEDVIEGSTSIIFLKDREGKFITINAALEKRLGMSREQLAGKTDYDIAPKELADYWRQHDLVVLETAKAIQIEERADLPDGHHIFLTNKFPLVDVEGQVYGVGAISHDITERKQIELKLKETSKTLAEAQKVAHVGSFEYFPATRTTTWSQEEYRIYGLDPAGPPPDYGVMLEKCIHPSERDLLHETFSLAMQNHAIYELEHRITRPDGSVRWVYDRAEPYFDERGELARYVGTTLDITQRKETELHLLELKESAEAGNRAKTIFLANMSHELRTPVAGVMGMIDLALRRATDPKQTDWLNKSKSSAQRLLNVVNDILDYSKAEADRLPLEEKNFSLRQLIDDAIALHGIAAQAKGLHVTREISSALPDQLCGDVFRLKQVLHSLLGNSCRFSDQGTITVRVNAVDEDGGTLMVRIEVEDQGVGISTEKQATLFHPFTQVDGSMTRKHGGAGLGLAIAKRLANLMGGDMGMTSQEGRGSTFWVTVRLTLAKANELGI